MVLHVPGNKNIEKVLEKCGFASSRRQKFEKCWKSVVSQVPGTKNIEKVLERCGFAGSRKQKMFEKCWKNAVLQVPRSKNIDFRLFLQSFFRFSHASSEQVL